MYRFPAIACTVVAVTFSLISLTPCPALSQTIWVVSNDPVFTEADFDTIQNAIDAAASGDFIYIHGTPFDYVETIHLSKKLHIVGPGFWKSENSIPDPNLNEAYLNGSIYFDPGSDTSVIEGMTVNGIVYVESDHVIIRHNQIRNFGHIEFVNMPEYISVYGNYIARCFRLPGMNINIYNNICTNAWDNNVVFWYANAGNVACLFVGNSLRNTSNPNSECFISNVTFRNNIVHCADFDLVDCTMIEHNIFTDEDVEFNGIPQPGLADGNVDSVDIADVWNLSDPSPDGKYRLIGTSMTNPAISGGVSGEDCGAYGGSTPYILSGIINIPSIYYMLVPPTGDTTNMLNVTIKAKSND